jgi:hypothetical protein
MRRAPARPTASDRAVIAALLWDLPALVRGSVGAKAFREVMGPGPWQPIEDDHDDVLARAASGLLAERHGNGEEARRVYASLAEDSRYWPNLLGKFLLTWSEGVQETDVFEAAIEQVRMLDRGNLKARLLSKLASLALDRRREDLFDELVQEATESAEAGSLLHRALTYEVFNFGVTRRFPLGQDTTPEADPLVSLDWIDTLALRGARGSLEDLLAARARSPWSWSFRSGRLPVHEVIAAEEQARWAGALWKRQALRRHAGGQILIGTAENQELLLYGLNLWITGGGKDVSMIIDFVEPQLQSNEGIDDLVAPLITGRPADQIPGYRLGEVSLALWDLLSDAQLVALLDYVAPSADYPKEVDLGRRLWALTCLRVTAEVEARIPNLPVAARLVLLENLSVTALDLLASDAAMCLLAAIGRSEASGAALGAAARLASKVGDDPAPFIKRVSPRELLDALDRYPEGAAARQLSEAERVLREELEMTITAAEQGTYSFGGPSPAADLARLAEVSGHVTKRSVHALRRAATNAAVPATIRLDGLLALGQLGHAGLLTADDLKVVEAAPDFGSPSSFMERDVPTELIRAAKLLIRASATRIRRSEESELMLLVRAEDARVRQVAVNAIGLALASRASDRLESNLLAALYDPDQGTVERAIVGVQNAQLTSALPLSVALQRFQALMKQSNRRVRRQVAHAAVTLVGQAHGRNAKELREILRLARHDRSWLVRWEVRLAEIQRRPT